MHNQIDALQHDCNAERRFEGSSADSADAMTTESMIEHQIEDEIKASAKEKMRKQMQEDNQRHLETHENAATGTSATSRLQDCSLRGASPVEAITNVEIKLSRLSAN